jgi:hypothetical protein
LCQFMKYPMVDATSAITGQSWKIPILKPPSIHGYFVAFLDRREYAVRGKLYPYQNNYWRCRVRTRGLGRIIQSCASWKFWVWCEARVIIAMMQLLKRAIYTTRVKSMTCLSVRRSKKIGVDGIRAFRGQFSWRLWLCLGNRLAGCPEYQLVLLHLETGKLSRDVT